MTFTALSELIYDKLDDKYHGYDNYDAPTTIVGHAAVRFGHLFTIPVRCLTASLDTMMGLASIPLTILTLGMDRNIYKFTDESLEAGQQLISHTFRSLLSTIDPELLCEPKYRLVNNTGFFAGSLQTTFEEYAKECKESDSGFHQQITSRLTYAVGGLLAAALRIADFALGIFCGVIALSGNLLVYPFAPEESELAKMVSHATAVAFWSLQLPGIVRDIYGAVAKTLNPWIAEEV